jgi:hypothetical protein
VSNYLLAARQTGTQVTLQTDGSGGTNMVLTLDPDTGEQAALKLTVSNTDIGAGAASAVPFTITGLDSEDTGTVTFSDGTNQVTVNVNGQQTNYTANLTSLADGTITSTLFVNTDSAGNSFTPVAGNSVTLDQDSGEQAALKLTVSNTNIGAGTSSAVPFTIAGVDPEDTGTVTFTDANNKTVVVSLNGGQTNYTANLTALADGTITSTLALSADSAGNSFTPVAGTTVMLDQDTGEQAALKLTVNNSDIGSTVASD